MSRKSKAPKPNVEKSAPVDIEEASEPEVEAPVVEAEAPPEAAVEPEAEPEVLAPVVAPKNHAMAPAVDGGHEQLHEKLHG